MKKEIRSPVSDYREMTGWPGTIPAKRLRLATQAIQQKDLEELQQDDQLRQDTMDLVRAHNVNMFSSQSEPAGEKEDGAAGSIRNWEATVLRARQQDSQETIGGVLVWKQGETEDRLVFELSRHPEWLGLNRVLPYMEGMRVVAIESQVMPDRTGLILAQNAWDNDMDQGFPEMPGGEDAEVLERVLRWHGAVDVRWVPTEMGGRGRRC